MNNETRSKLEFFEDIKLNKAQKKLNTIRRQKKNFGELGFPVDENGNPDGQMSIVMPTGAGKTISFFEIMAEMSQYVHSKNGMDDGIYFIFAPRIALVEQICDSARKVFGLPDVQAQPFFGSVANNAWALKRKYETFQKRHGKKPYVVVGTIQSAARIEETGALFKNQRCIVFDEVHEIIKDSKKSSDRKLILANHAKNENNIVVINTTATPLIKGERRISDLNTYGKMLSVSKKFCIDKKVIVPLELILSKGNVDPEELNSLKKDFYYSVIAKAMENEEERITSGEILNQKCMITIKSASRDHVKFLNDFMDGTFHKFLPDYSLAHTDSKNGKWFNGKRIYNTAEWINLVEECNEKLIVSHWGQLTMGIDIKSINSGILFRESTEDNVEQIIGRGLRSHPNKKKFSFYILDLNGSSDMTSTIVSIAENFELNIKNDILILSPAEELFFSGEKVLDLVANIKRSADGVLEELKFLVISAKYYNMTTDDLLKEAIENIDSKKIRRSCMKFALMNGIRGKSIETDFMENKLADDMVRDKTLKLVGNERILVAYSPEIIESLYAANHDMKMVTYKDESDKMRRWVNKIYGVKTTDKSLSACGKYDLIISYPPYKIIDSTGIEKNFFHNFFKLSLSKANKVSMLVPVDLGSESVEMKSFNDMVCAHHLNIQSNVKKYFSGRPNFIRNNISLVVASESNFNSDDKQDAARGRLPKLRPELPRMDAMSGDKNFLLKENESSGENSVEVIVGLTTKRSFSHKRIDDVTAALSAKRVHKPWLLFISGKFHRSSGVVCKVVRNNSLKFGSGIFCVGFDLKKEADKQAKFLKSEEVFHHLSHNLKDKNKLSMQELNRLPDVSKEK